MSLLFAAQSWQQVDSRNTYIKHLIFIYADMPSHHFRMVSITTFINVCYFSFQDTSLENW